MTEPTTTNGWKRWSELSDSESRLAVGDPQFWSGLSQGQRDSFLAEASWQQIQLVSEAKQLKLSSLLSLEEICRHLELTDTEVHWLVSTRKLPAWLVGGSWKFDKQRVDRWSENMGGAAAIRSDVKDQIATHGQG